MEFEPEGDRGPHLLLVAFYFPPARASGVFRARAIANHLVRRGWYVTVLTADAWFFEDVLRQADPGLLSTIDERVVIERVTFEGRRLDRDLRRHGWFRGNFPKVADRWLTRWEQRRFPDPYAPWIPVASAAGVEIHRRRPIDVVLATGNPFSSFEVARRVAARATVPYVLDYRDAWTLDQFGEVPAFPEGDRVWDAERRVLDDASLVTFVNAAQQTWYAERHPSVAGRMRVIENGWDPELLEGDHRRSHDGIRLGYVGTITRHLPWDALFAGWDLIRDDPELQDVSIDLYGHLGFFEHSRAALAALLPTGEDTRVHYRGPLPKDQVGEAYEDLDALLLVTPGSRYVTCQKAYEYLAFGKPIVSVNRPGTDARAPLEGYPLAFNVESLAPEHVARELRAAVDASRRPDPDRVEGARRHARRFERVRRLEELERELTGLIRG